MGHLHCPKGDVCPTRPLQWMQARGSGNPGTEVTATSDLTAGLAGEEGRGPTPHPQGSTFEGGRHPSCSPRVHGVCLC